MENHIPRELISISNRSGLPVSTTWPSLSHNISQAGQRFKRAVDSEVDKIYGTAAVVKKHLAIREAFQHIFKQQAIAGLTFGRRILRSPGNVVQLLSASRELLRLPLFAGETHCGQKENASSASEDCRNM